MELNSAIVQFPYLVTQATHDRLKTVPGWQGRLKQLLEEFAAENTQTAES